MSSSAAQAPRYTPVKNRPCPICQCAQVKVLYTQRFFPLSDGSLLSGYDVAACRECGFVYADNIPPQDVFDTYYREMSKYEFEYSGGQESESDFKRFRSIADTISRLVPDRNTRILDIGCATGGLLSVLKQMGYVHLKGLDPSPRCAETARKLYNVEVMTCPISELAGRPERYDLIILIGVIEHIRDLDASLRGITGLLAPGGALFGEVPDATRFHLFPDAPFQEFSTEHIDFFSTPSFRNLLARYGLREVAVEEYSRNYSVTTIMPSIAGLYRQDLQVAREPLQRDDVTEPALMQYIAQSTKIEQEIEARIERISAEGRPIIVWGVGTHTQRLMARGCLGKANIIAFVDSNPRYAGKTMNGVPIILPAALKTRPEPILVSSRVFEKDIARQIRQELKLPNDVTLLYNV